MSKNDKPLKLAKNLPPPPPPLTDEELLLIIQESEELVARVCKDLEKLERLTAEDFLIRIR